MADLNLGQDVANKRERKQAATHVVAISYPLQQAVGMHRYGSLININPSGFTVPNFKREEKGRKGKFCIGNGV